MNVKNKTFSGGYRFKNFAGEPKEELVDVGIPEKVVIPLLQGFGNEVTATVKPGDSVKAGQVIGIGHDSVSSPVHSSVNGVVEEMTTMMYADREIKGISIKSDGTSDWEPLESYNADAGELSREQIEELLYLSGVASLDRTEGIPTGHRSSTVSPDDIEHIIVHGVDSEAYNTSLAVLLDGDNLSSFAEGLKILKKAMPQAKIHLALDREKKAVIDKVKGAAAGIDGIDMSLMAPKYPQSYNEVLVPAVLGMDFPYGYLAASMGITVLSVQAVIHVSEAVTQGKALIERTIALCGPSFKENVHVKVRVGTPLEVVLKDRLKDAPCRIVLDSLLTGYEVKDLSLPVDRTFSQIIAIPEDDAREFLAFVRPGFKKDSYSRSFFASFFGTEKAPDTNLHGDERPCIQCGYCVEVCPVDMIPTLVDRFIRKGIDAELMRYGIFNCIDCNLCTCVCPSKIPLAANFKKAKVDLMLIGCDHSMCILPKFDLKGLEEYKGIKVIR